MDDPKRWASEQDGVFLSFIAEDRVRQRLDIPVFDATTSPLTLPIISVPSGPASPETIHSHLAELKRRSWIYCLLPLSEEERTTTIDELNTWLVALAEEGFVAASHPEARLIDAGILPLHRTDLPPAQAIAALNQALWTRLREINTLHQLLRDADHRYAQAVRQIWHMEGQAATWKSRERTLEARLRELQERWQALEQSPGYAVLRALQRTRARFIPAHSRREHLLLMVAGWLRIAQTQGPGGLIRHFHGELRWRIHALRRRLTSRHRHTVVEIPAIPVRPPVTPHTATVDIVICVHNALEDVQRCLASVLCHTTPPYRLILVDDGSHPPARDFLARFAQEHPSTLLLRNEIATGYTKAANRGLEHCRSEFVALLNSDTQVTPGWLDRLIACAQSDPRIGLVGPLSNTASWQSVPQVSLGDDWADNPLPPELDLDTWAQAIADHAPRLYPAMPFLNGFCLLIRREVLEQVGRFDEVHFPQGYGEENDFALRAQAAGWRLALADDAFVYHAQSRSYDHDRRRALSEQADRTLRQLHPEKIIDRGVAYCRDGLVLEGIRARVAALPERLAVIRKGRERFAGRRILFLLPADAPGGGANVVIQEALAMQAMGVEVALFNLPQKRTGFQRGYPHLTLPVIFGDPADLPDLATDYDAVVATWYESVDWLRPLIGRGPVLGYYIQDVEAYFFPPHSPEYAQALASYTAVSGLRCFTKTPWNQQEVHRLTGVAPAVVGPSVDVDRLCPRDDTWDPAARPLRITAMVRPNSPRRGPRTTMQVLRRIVRRYGPRVAVTLFGVDPADPGFATLPQDFDWQLAGVITPEQVAWLLGHTDIFVDFSTYQAMGLTALEAMAAGAAVIVPIHGGADVYARDEENALVVDTHREERCYQALVRLVEDEALRTRLRRRALWDACRHAPEHAAYRILSTLFPAASSQD